MGNQTQLRGASGVEGKSEQDQLRRAEVAYPRRHRVARSEFRHDSEIDEGHLKTRALARVDEVAWWCRRLLRRPGPQPPPACRSRAMHSLSQILATCRVLGDVL